MTWTRRQQAIVAILPKISSFLSILGSGWTAIEIVTHRGRHVDIQSGFDRDNGNGSYNGSGRGGFGSGRQKRARQPKLKHPYHRLLLAMCIYDLLEAFWNFQSTWPIPADNDLRIWSSGTRGTCTAQGFFLQLAIAVPIYNASLAVYYMLVIVFRFTEKTLVTRVEPIMHFTAIAFSMSTSLIMVGMGYMNDANLWCWIAPYPAGCLDSLHHGNPPENPNPCTRGNFAWVFRWSFYFAPLWLSILTATVCTISVYCQVYKSEQSTLKYRRPEQSIRIAHSLLITSSMEERRSTADLSEANKSDALSVSDSITQMKQEFCDIADEEENENLILSGRKELYPAPTFPATPKTTNVATAQNQNQRSVPANSLSLTSSSNFNSISSMDDSSSHLMSVAEMRNEFKKQHQPQKSSLQRSLLVIQQWRERQNDQVKYNPRTAQVAQQSFWYLLTFFLTHIWTTINRIYQQLTGAPIFPLTVIHSFFDPANGLMNFFVYQRPRYMIVRKRHPHLGRLGAIRRILYFSFQQKNDVIQSDSGKKVKTATPPSSPKSTQVTGTSVQSRRARTKLSKLFSAIDNVVSNNKPEETIVEKTSNSSSACNKENIDNINDKTVFNEKAGSVVDPLSSIENEIITRFVKMRSMPLPKIVDEDDSLSEDEVENEECRDFIDDVEQEIENIHGDDWTMDDICDDDDSNNVESDCWIGAIINGARPTDSNKDREEAESHNSFHKDCGNNEQPTDVSQGDQCAALVTMSQECTCDSVHSVDDNENTSRAVLPIDIEKDQLQCCSTTTTTTTEIKHPCDNHDDTVEHDKSSTTIAQDEKGKP